MFSRNKSIIHIDTNVYMDNTNFYKILEKLKKKYSKEFIKDIENYQLNELDIEKNLKTININWIKSSYYKYKSFLHRRINVQGLNYEISMEKGYKKIRFNRLKKIITRDYSFIE